MATHGTHSSAMPGWLVDPDIPETADPVVEAALAAPAQQAAAPRQAAANKIDPPAGKEAGQPEEKQQPLFPGGIAESQDAHDENQHVGKKKKKRQPTPPFYRRPRLMLAIVIVSLLLVAGGIGWWLYARQYEWTDDAFIDGHAAQISAKVSGYVVGLLIKDNQLVHEGDVLLEIDPRDYQVALDSARAAYASAQGRLAQAKAQIGASDEQVLAAEADVTAAGATAKNAEQDLERNSNLAPRGAVSQQSLDAAVATARSTASQLLAAEARAAAAHSQAQLARSQAVTAEADLKEREVAIRQAELNLSYTKIVAPITGRITHRTVELGDYLQPGQALLAIVDPNVWVTANYKETQLTHMHVGQKVSVRVDAFPSQRLAAHVDSFQRGTGSRFTLLPAENATGNYVKIVQRVPVKIVFDQPPPADMILGPGMSVVPTVTVR